MLIRRAGVQVRANFFLAIRYVIRCRKNDGLKSKGTGAPNVRHAK